MTPGSQPIQHQLTAWLTRRTPQTGVRRVAPLAAAIASELGSVRQENQDRSLIARGRNRSGDDYAIVAVADGIGGMRDGAKCAAIALASFVASVDEQAKSNTNSPDHWLRIAAEFANQAVHSCLRGDGGSTLVALLISREGASYWLSVGDSRVYTSSTKGLVQISVDDTIAGQLGKGSDAPFEQSKLLQYIGMGEDLEPHVNLLDSNAITGALLTTDGVHYLASAPDWLGQIVRNAADPGICVKRLVDLAKWCGGPDNATTAMIALPIEWEVTDRPLYPFLEVWDAFGEIQLVVNDAPQQFPSTRPLNVEAPTTGQLSGPTLQIDESPRPEKSSPPDAPPKGRRAKGKSKAKSPSKPDKPATPLAESEPPQLRMEFPSKSSG